MHRTLAVLLILGLGSAGCYAPDDPMVKSRIEPDETLETNIRRAANGEPPLAAEMEPAARPAPAAAPAPAAPAASAPAPEPAPVEVAKVSADPAAGKKLYATYCSSCHGAGGAGDGPAAAGLNPKPTKHTDGTYMNTLSNDHLYLVIDKGGTAVGKSALMTPWGTVMSEKEIWDVVAFTRSLADPPYTGPGI